MVIISVIGAVMGERFSTAQIKQEFKNAIHWRIFSAPPILHTVV